MIMMTRRRICFSPAAVRFSMEWIFFLALSKKSIEELSIWM